MNSRLHDKANNPNQNPQQVRNNPTAKRDTEVSTHQLNQLTQKIPNNNINININFSVKEKNNCFVGKKIDNLIEISNPSALQKSTKNTKNAQRQKYTKDARTSKESYNEEKLRYKPTKQSISVQAIKKPKNIKSKRHNHMNHDKYHELQQFYEETQTPDKDFRGVHASRNHQSQIDGYESKSKSKSKSRSKSAISKSKKYLNSKSTKNLAIQENTKTTLQKNHRKSADMVKQKRNLQKEYSPDISSDTQKSESLSKNKSNSKTQSKSYKKLLKTKRDSDSKPSVAFQNSGIKKHFNNIEEKDPKKYDSHSKRSKSQSTVNKSLGVHSTNKRPTEEELNNIQAYMNQKKRKQKNQRQKTRKLEKQSFQRKKEELKRVQKEQRQNASKKVEIPQSLKKKSLSNKSRKKFSIPHLGQNEEDLFDQQSSYNKIREQAEILIYSKESSFGSPIKVQQKVNQQWQKSKGKSSVSKPKKFVNQKYNQLIKNYLEGKLQANRNKYPYSQYLIQLGNTTTTIQRFYRGYLIRKKFASELYNLQIQVSTKMSKFKNLKNSNFWKEQGNNSSCNSIIKIHDSQYNSQEKGSSKSSKSVKNTFAQQIQSLRKNLLQQNQKCKQLELQNEELKKNFRKKVQKQQDLLIQLTSDLQLTKPLKQNDIDMSESLKLQKHQKNQDGFNNEIQSRQFQPKEEAEGLNKTPFDKGKQLVQLKKPKRKQLKIQIESTNNGQLNEELQRQHLKKIMESYTCSPKNSSFEMSSSRVKDPNILELFQKKELKLENKFQKKTQMFDKMLNEHLVSPRTYNVKIIDLEQAYQKQRKRIQKRKKEAKRVAQYIQSIEKQAIQGDQLESNENQNDNIVQQHSETKSQSSVKQQDESDLQKSQQLNNNKWINSIQQIDKEETKKVNKSHKRDLRRLPNEKSTHSEQQIQQDIIIQPLKAEKSKAQEIFNRIKSINDELGESSQQQSQEQSQSHSVSHSQETQRQSQNFEVTEQNENPPKQQPKGFQTNLTFVKQYCIGLCQFIRAHDHLKQEFWRNIFSPISYDHFQMLKAYRTTSQNQNCASYNSHRTQFLYPFFKEIFPKVQAIPHQVFQQFNRTNNRLTANNEQSIRYLQQCYLQSILDAFNQSLDHERPGSIHGQQLPWSADSKHLKNLNQVSSIEDMEGQSEQKKFDQFFGVAIARLIQWGSCLCGFIPQSLELQPDQKIQFDEEQINHVRQTRMALMLQKAIKEDDNNMIDSQLQLTQVRLALGAIIFQTLVTEAMEDICEIIL